MDQGQTLQRTPIESAEASQPRHIKLTSSRVEGFTCPSGKRVAFLRDNDVRGLAVRITDNGVKSYVVEQKLDGKTMRMTIGRVADWPLDSVWDGTGSRRSLRQSGAREEARRLLSIIDVGKDPREEKKKGMAADRAERDASRAERVRHELTGLQAWEAYRLARASRWGERGRHDHDVIVQEGGRARVRSKVKLTQPGPLRKLLSRPLTQLDSKTVSAWLSIEAARRPAVAGKSFRMLRAFINWCVEHEEYASIVQKDCCTTRKTRALVPKTKAKQDALQREQLGPWFAEVRRLPNPVMAACLQTLLLTGARREEVMSMRWVDVDFAWKRISIKDKVEGGRVIPLTPYVAGLLSQLPRVKNNPWVFVSSSAKSGRLQEPRLNHNKILAAAGLPHITIHGLRRSFGTLAEWVETPVGVVAQIQGHKPSALIEKHYRVRPIDLLRGWHVKLESWILEQAGIGSIEDRPQLRLVEKLA